MSLILPITVLILVPLYIERNISIKNIWTLLTGLFIMLTGLIAMIVTISAFIRIGKGTLAPWNPTGKMITGGMYGYVRNPMIMRVMTVLIGESVAIMSMPIFMWAGIFFLLNTLYFILYEEPDLEKKFGDEYREYKRNVRRWIPRSKPYNPSRF